MVVVQTEIQCCHNEECGFGAVNGNEIGQTNIMCVCVCNCRVTRVLQMMIQNGIPVLFVDRYSMCTECVLAAENIGNNV